MLKEVNWSIDRDYKTGSSDEPLQFYLDALCNSTTFDLLLGYFSSSAINLLSLGFANFIYSGGKMRAVINNVLSEEDKNAIANGQNKESFSNVFNFEDIKSLHQSLDKYGKHFFECFSWLIANNKIEIKIIKPKGGKGISHYKSGVFSDGENSVSYKSSCNFTYYGFIENLEELECRLAWDDERSKRSVDKQIKDFDAIFSGDSKHVEYLDIEEVKATIKSEFGNKDIHELLIQEKELLNKKDKIFNNPKIKNSIRTAVDKFEEFEQKEIEPHFPLFDNKLSEPRLYQKEAHSEWIKNNYKGIFAMATGTGKTITALNCVLEEFKKTKKYNIIIIVPTIDLVNQWKEELERFNFSNILQVSSKHNWKNSFVRFVQNTKYDIRSDIAIVTTYRSFVNENFFKLYKQVESNFILIGDEAHNIGSKQVLKKFKLLNTPKMIALSATPKRIYDLEGTKSIEEVFKDKEPYTYVFSLERAIKEKFLTRYLYFPKIVKLNEEEFEEYKIITKKLIPFFNDEGGLGEGAQMLLLKRKRIIHKAKNKEIVFKEILNELDVKNKLAHSFIFAPEGKYKENDVNILNSFIKIATDTFPKLKVDSFTSKDVKRDEILKSFEKGTLDMVFAMKALDEGVDIPRTEVGVFTSSTGNPRQFIQRRGRVLRKHIDKDIAIIYDMIVVPDLFSEDTFNLERSLLKQELTRVGYFADLADNFYQAKEVLNEISEEYNLNLETIISDLQDDN